MLPMKTLNLNLKPSFVPLIAIVVTLIFTAQVNADAHGNDDKVMSVTGSASASVEPDLVTVRFGVETKRESPAAALGANADLMQSVIDSLKSAGITEDEISTSRFNIHAVYDSHQDPDTGRRSQVLSGYQVSNILSIETAQMNLIATIIDTAVGAGVNRIEGVQFSISPAVMAVLKDDLIAQAVLNARAKAEKALAPLNHKITGVKSITLNDFQQPTPRMAGSARMEMAMSAPTQIFSSDQDVRTVVNIIFLIGVSKSE